MKKGILLVLILTIFIAICTFTACKDTSGDNVNDGGQHVHSLTTQVIPSTCTIQGRKTSTCECGYVFTEVLELDSENHQFGAWSVVTPSTCTTNGSQVRACTCGAQETGSLELNLNNHTFGEWITTPSTCITQGNKTRTCQCGGQETEELALDPNNHEFSEWITTPSTCITQGSKTRTCECGEEETEELALDPNNHEFSEWITTPSTCITQGSKIRTCECGEEETIELEINPNNHELPECGHLEESGGYDGSAVTIKFYHTMGAALRDVLDTYIAEFNELYPNITIEHEQVGSYNDLKDIVNSAISQGTQPNIAYCYPEHVAEYNQVDAVIPLDSFIYSEVVITREDGSTEILGLTDNQKNDFIQGFLDEGKQYGDGRTYTLPFSKTSDVLYYNKTFFEEYNLSVPTTWEEMEELCERIKLIDPDCIPLGYDSESDWFINMCAQYGSPFTSTEENNHYLFDNDTNKAFVKMLREWYQKGYVTTMGTDGMYSSTSLIDRTCYMSIALSSSASRYRWLPTGNSLEVGIVPIPQVDVNNPKVKPIGANLCILDSENTQEEIASWLFVKFLTTNVELQADFSMRSAYTPVIKSVKDNATYQEFLATANGSDNISSHIAALALLASLSQEQAYFALPAFVGCDVARTAVGELLVNCLTEDADDVDQLIDDAFKTAIKNCTKGTTEEEGPIDYVSQLKLDESTTTQKTTATVDSYVDGDTILFTVPISLINNEKAMKCRLIGVDAPESTGTIEDYGYAAARFTKTALQNAVSIIIESDNETWNYDSAETRYFVWVWYKTEAEGEYRNLNIELLQNGLANLVANETRYSEVATNAFNQAKAEKLNIHSGVADPEVGGDNDDNVEEPVLITITKTMEEMATELSWENGVKYNTFNLDEVVTVTSEGSNNTGKYYVDDKTYRLYQTANSTLTIAVAEGYEIVSVKITYNYSNAGTLLLDGEAVTSKTEITVNDASITFGVGSTSDATNGQAKIKAIEVIYVAL